MADVTDQIAVRFVAEDIRQIAEKLRDLRIVVVIAVTKWADLTGKFANDASSMVREDRKDAVDNLSAADVLAFMTRLNSARAAISDKGVIPDEIAKFCVRDAFQP